MSESEQAKTQADNPSKNIVQGLLGGVETFADNHSEIIYQGLLGNVEILLEHIRSDAARQTLKDCARELVFEERRKIFGERVKQVRQALKITQAELAKKLGVTPQAVAAYEKGKREPTFKNLISLSQILNVSVDWLIGNPVRL